MDKFKRINLFMGNYGSGKTNIAVNYAVMLQNKGFDTTIYDLDIVNPYFRTVDGKEILDKSGVQLVASQYAKTNVDIPAMAAQNYMMIDNKSRYAVVDVGGDDRGALALGRYAKSIIEEDNYEMLLVINKYRFETQDSDGVIEIKNEIESSCKINFTGIVNNSNLGIETTVEDIVNSFDYAMEVSKATGLDIKFTCVKKDLYEKVKQYEKNLLPIELIKYVDWQ
jgi:septum formation inhibitor-activating ATPase MinD